MSADVSIRNVSMRYSKASDSGGVFDIDTSIPSGKFTTLLGESGSGKTTLLRLLAGFIRPDSGEIAIHDSVVASDTTFVPTQDRDLAMVFQSYALWPHMTVFENVAFGLKAKRVAKSEVAERVAATLDLVGLGHLEERKPGQLSGGQQQRVALARSLVLEPGLLLLDEPLSNLDADLRLQMRNQLKSLQIKTGITFVYVTHDQEEAFALSDHMIVMEKGRILQQGRCEDLYSRPKTERVAQFMGRGGIHLNGAAFPSQDGCIFETAIGDTHTEGLGSFPTVDPDLARGSSAHLVVQAENLRLSLPQVPLAADVIGLDGTIQVTNFAGRESHVDVKLADQQIVTAYEPIGNSWRAGDAVQVRFDRASAWIFPTDPKSDPTAVTDVCEVDPTAVRVIQSSDEPSRTDASVQDATTPRTAHR